MSALTAARVKTQHLGTNPQSAGVAGTYKIYQGSIVMMNASGYVRPGATAAAMIGVGVALPNTYAGTNGTDSYDNSAGADAAISCYYSEGVFGPFDNSGSSIGIGDVGKVCYIVDDQTVHLTSNSGARSPAGIVKKVDSAGVYVLFDPAVTRAGVGEAAPSGVTFTQTYSTAAATVAALTYSAPAGLTSATLTDSSGGSADTTIAAITQLGNAGSADVGPTKDAIADLAAQINALRVDLSAVRTAVLALGVDVLDMKKNDNQVIDVLQAVGSAG